MPLSVSFVPRILRHLLCVAALMWTGIVNGQAFYFFSDSTTYVRTADVAVYLLSGKRYSTAWTERYGYSLEQNSDARWAGKSAKPPAPKANLPAGNDLSSGTIMGGRSPYIGALMYAAYVTTNFWAFVILQAAIAYGLILLTLKRIGRDDPLTATGIVLALSALTSLPTYNSLLLADAFTGFGILAFILLAAPGQWSRTELVFLMSVVVVSAISHLTHIWIIAGMTAILLIANKAAGLKCSGRTWIVGSLAVLIGVLSIQATAIATKAALGKEPQLLPLLSARFIADGPGQDYIKSGCDNRRFQICRIKIGHPDSNPLILFSTSPEDGGYLMATPEQRRRMGREDIAFAAAVLAHDPAGQIGMILRNTFRQLTWIDYDGLNVGCWDRPDCWHSLPDSIKAELKQTPSGQNAWPQSAMNAILYVTVLGSLAVIAVLAFRLRHFEREQAELVRILLLAGFTAFLISAFLGGGVAEPQYRYTGRIIWLVPFAAAILLALAVKGAGRATRPQSSSGSLANLNAG